MFGTAQKCNTNLMETLLRVKENKILDSFEKQDMSE